MSELVTVEELMKWLNCSRSTINRLSREGDLVPVYLDRRPRYEVEQVRRFIMSRRVTWPYKPGVQVIADKPIPPPTPPPPPKL